MSHCASFLYLNALFEASFFRAEHLTASEKYKFSRQKDIIREFCKAKLGKQGFALRHKMLSEVSDTFTAFNEVLELAEICSPQATERWNERKFVHSVRQCSGTRGNSLPASDGTLERAEICSQRSTGHWNRRKFVASVQRGTGASGNLFTAINKTLERAEIVAVLRTAYRVFFENSQMFGAACRNERNLSQRGALFMSQIKDLLIEFLLHKKPPQRTARKIE